MIFHKTIKIFICSMLLFLISNCNIDLELFTIENSIRTKLDKYEANTDFSFAIKANNGYTFIHNTGEVTEFTFYRSSSTSKLVTAVVILNLVEEGILSLEDHPQDYISEWPDTGNLSLINLRHLLNFTSGLTRSPLCLQLANSDFETCVGNIADINSDAGIPGENFFYSSTHLQVAGLMAIIASGASTWEEVFNDFKSDTGLFENSLYDLPSIENPRVAGGMHWNVVEYLEFLGALYNEKILNKDMLDQMTNDQIEDVVIEYSPILQTRDEDWHYGFGCWIECHANPYNCTQRTRVSSPGAKGSYPFIDFENQYYGIIASESSYDTEANGYFIFMSVLSELEAWAEMNLE